MRLTAQVSSFLVVCVTGALPADVGPTRFDGAPPDAQGRVVVHADLSYFTVRVGDEWRIETRQRRGTDWAPGQVLHIAKAPAMAMSPALDDTGEHLYFESNLRVPAVEGRQDSDVWMMERRNQRWDTARALAAPFATPFNEHSPTVAAGLLCFNSSRPDGLGGNDIYCGPLDAAPTLVSTISSSAQDAGPWLAGKGDVLLFTSNREGGEGGWDLYAATRTADGWSAPRNLGAPINTAGDELWPTWTDGRLYFKRSGGTEAPGYLSSALPLPR